MFVVLTVALHALLAELVPKFMDMVETEKDRSMAMTALHCMQEMLDSIGEPVLRISQDAFVQLVTTVKKVLQGKVSHARYL